jgi:hypothetical protein
MKNVFLFALLLGFSLNLLAQGGNDPFKGPINISSPGVIDGVVLNDEVPLASKVEYEHVRLSDYVWSKRVFSRIDAREKMNQTIFYPYDYFVEDFVLPKNKSEINKKDWVKHQERYSLWTIILTHIMLGDVHVYNVANPDFPTVEDGYQLKYPVVSSSVSDPFFTDPIYKKKISRMISFGGPGPKWEYEDGNANKDYFTVIDSSESFDVWFDNLAKKEEMEFIKREPKDLLKISYEEAVKNSKQYLAKADIVNFISSQSISAYNIKEDWFFDKERSVLDKRIIAIAPVGRYVMPEEAEDLESWEVSNEGLDRFRSFVSINQTGAQIYVNDGGTFSEYIGPTIEREMFWLYFPELRNVIVNYFVYNDKSDAQWMSFDDLFWKRRFTGQIYKSSNRFDQDIEDYRYGVDALYQAELFKNTMRNWEHDVWNY